MLIGKIGAGKNTSAGIVDIALIQSLIHDDEVDEIVKNYGMVLVDECHHAASLNYEKVLGAVNARYVYGLTATPKRQDGQHPVVFMHCGPIRYSVNAKEQAEKRNFDHLLIPCFTGFTKPLTQEESNWHITDIYSSLAENESRNQQIVIDIVDAVANNRTPIVLTQRKEHVARLAEMLSGRTDARVVTLIGSGTQKEKREMSQTLDAVMPDEKLVIIATGKYVGEDFDYPRLDTLFLASPIAWKGTLAQYAGRLHRDYSGKQDVVIYDYVDIHVPVLERMYHKRLRGYAQIGYKAIATKGEPDKINMIYDADNFVSILNKDIADAKQKIIIVSPYIQRKQMEEVFRWLDKPLREGVLVTFVTRPPESYKDPERAKRNIEYLQSRVTVIQSPDIYHKFAVIDNRIVWYGSIGLLSSSNFEDSIMRLDARDLASELLGIVGPMGE